MRKFASTSSVAGGVPRADLLPPRIRLLRKERRNRRNLGIVALVVVVVCGLTFWVTETLKAQSNSMLVAEEDKTNQILAEQSKYSQVIVLFQTIDRLKASEHVVSAPEVIWSTVVPYIVESIPAGGSVTSLSLVALSALESAPGTDPLLGEVPVVTISLTVDSPSFSGIESILFHARTWPGYSSMVVNGVSSDTGTYQGNLTIYLNAKVLGQYDSGGYQTSIIGSL